ncbi:MULTISPECIES: hypothetical protein [unclassified Streptomyces]|uniref:hypothetical protein n=1 Tax=unclassified Streptomyces TaxID=2593676 RepID=UPI0004C284B0|nr:MULTISPECIES: hypothetical protein [unclassified Streptomyces]
MNRVALGLAVGAGYVLGRTKKMKMAFAVGTLVAGKKMQLSPRAVADLVNQQLKNNPQFKEIGDQLRTDLRGVGKAASGALVERQISGIADRLHNRTGQLRDQVSGVASKATDLPGTGGGGREDDEESEGRGREDSGPAEDRDERADPGSDEQSGDDRDETPRRRPAKKAPARKAAKKAPAKRTAEGAGGAAGAAKKTARTAKQAPAKKAAPAKKTTAAKGAARRATGGQSGEGRR